MKKLILAAVMAFSASQASAAALITFEEPVAIAMSNSPGAPVPLTARLSNQYLATLGVTFSSGAGYVAVVDHVPSCSFCTPTPPNIIGGTAVGDTLSYETAITAAFFNTANISQQATTNFVRVLGDWFPFTSGSAFLEAYDISGNFITSVNDTDTGPQGQGPDLSISAPGIHSVRFYSDNATVGFDNFQFGDLTSAVPEPATWLMMIAGFGLLGASMRRQRRALAAA